MSGNITSLGGPSSQPDYTDYAMAGERRGHLQAINMNLDLNLTEVSQEALP